MSAHASSSATPPLPPPNHPPTSISPTVPSSSSSTHAPSIANMSMISPSLRSPETARQIAEARAALEASMSNIGSSLDRTLQSRAQDLHSNSRQLEKQQKEVEKATEGLRKEGDKLKKVADEGMKKVKELGNVQNWAEMLERDFLVLGETLRLARGESESGSFTRSESEWETGSEGSGMVDGGKPVGASDGSEGAKNEGNHFVSKDSISGEAGQRAVDADGGTQMGGAANISADRGKGKAVEAFADAASMQSPITAAWGSSTATTTTGSTSDPSSSSAHTAASVASQLSVTAGDTGPLM
ncbi:hypothetical protein WAI453_006382 [Rhynchosporium graminicola]|uniref:Biogenesis of lysosome-related organelles complex 1 subunit 1 n=1 Tax=Rhynchosporium graminicola TaxID=2792576 RepID=A0A1E1LHV7_9HELO|nr:uncharacterized protein RCO7_03216 [Rhynchosporium commune]